MIVCKAPICEDERVDRGLSETALAHYGFEDYAHLFRFVASGLCDPDLGMMLLRTARQIDDSVENWRAVE